MNNNFDIGARLRQIRNQKGVSQEELVNLAEITSTYYGLVERNLKNITVIKLEQLCGALNITLADFFDTSAELPVDTKEDLAGANLKLLIDRLSPKQKKSALKILQEATHFNDEEKK